MAIAQQKAIYTPEQYLELERAAEYRSEYVAGEIFAMSGASRSHNTITKNALFEIHSQVRSGPCEAYVNDMRLNVGAAFFYPDVMVTCGEIELLDSHQDTLLNPVVIIEVLSPSTERYDQGLKFRRYTQIRSLHDYILIRQDECCIEHFVRQPDDKWLVSLLTEMSDVLAIDSIGCRLNVADIYSRIEFGQ